MAPITKNKDTVTVLFAGDSGDGMQLTGTQFTSTHALFGNDVSTFPDFPAEIRAPKGTVSGVSGFQVKFGSSKIFTPGDAADVLVVMNAAAYKANIHKLKPGGILIANEDGFDSKNLKLAGYHDESPLQSTSVEAFILHKIPVTDLTLKALEDSSLSKQDKLKSKNMFVLGFLFWMFDRSLQPTIDYLNDKFARIPEVAQANTKALKAGHHFADTAEVFTSRYTVDPAEMEPGQYRAITGNEALALGLIAASRKADLPLFYGSYPITPASDILHELSKHKNFGVKTFQAEDEIAAATAAIGASFAGSLAVTASSGPGIALKTEAAGLAVILEIPLVFINVQRGGPSTGLPTKTEQADLMQAIYGRNGEAPMPVIAVHSPVDAFYSAIKACRIAVEHMTPVMLLSDGYIANGSAPWKFPKASDLPLIRTESVLAQTGEEYLPYRRDEKLVRKWAIPGTAGLEHRIGGLEKDFLTGDVSYDPDNHEKMVKVRAEKIARIADFVPEQEIEAGEDSGDVLILSWGSTYGAVNNAVEELVQQGEKVSSAHLKYLNPLPKNLAALLSRFNTILVPEMNDGQLVRLIQGKLNIKCKPFNKIKGIPFTAAEIKERALYELKEV